MSGQMNLYEIQNGNERREYYAKLWASGQKFNDEETIELVTLALFRNDGEPLDSNPSTIREILMRHKSFKYILDEGYEREKTF